MGISGLGLGLNSRARSWPGPCGRGSLRGRTAIAAAAILTRLAARSALNLRSAALLWSTALRLPRACTLRALALAGPAALRTPTLRASLLILSSALLAIASPAGPALVIARRTIALRAASRLLVTCLLAGCLSLIGRTAFAPRGSALPLRAGTDHRQGDSPPLLVNLHYPDLNDITHGHDFMRIANETVGQATNVHQAAVVHADIDETAEIDHVEDCTGQFHAGRQVFELQDALFEDRRGKVLAGVPAGTGQLGENVPQGQSADHRFLGDAARPASGREDRFIGRNWQVRFGCRWNLRDRRSFLPPERTLRPGPRFRIRMQAP